MLPRERWPFDAMDSAPMGAAFKTAFRPSATTLASVEHVPGKTRSGDEEWLVLGSLVPWSSRFANQRKSAVRGGSV
jgi:hypothetical protein